jgi:hypothetical protein
MAKNDSASKAAMVVSIGAAIAAAYALTQKRAQAAEPSQIVSLDEATMNLLIAIAQASGDIDSTTLDALDKLQEILDKIGAGAPGGQGWPPNAEGIRSFAVLCPAAATAYPVPDMEIPDGMALAIKNSPLNAAAALIFVARTPAECTNPNSSWPLVWNEAITYLVKNANAFYVSTNIAGSLAVFTAEQRS